jgi:hypothetical protein
VYELQGKLEEAREAYLKVGGGYQQYAKLQADRLAKPEAKETYAWLETARAPLPRAPWGPGTPGQRPAFSEGELALPAESATGPALPGSTTAPAASIEELLKGLELDFESPPAEGDRYAPGATPPAATDTPPSDASQQETPSDGASTESATTPPAGDAAPRASDAPASGAPAAGTDAEVETE